MTTQFDIAKLAKAVGKLPVQPNAVPRTSGLRIGLVNNMPDGALLATEQQFEKLIAHATGGQLALQLYYLPSLPRGEVATQILHDRYLPIADLYRNGIDALIVTGNEPRAARLDQEPYWPEMTTLIDWARYNTASTYWSCLAAHAAVLHLDKIERRRLPSKLSGAYTCRTSENGNGLAKSLVICHSRLNEVPKAELEKAGYRILSQSAGGEVDAFIKSMPSRFLFLQGHPEYAALSLAREYRRDVDRYLNGTRDLYPEMPENYFDMAATENYLQFRKQVERRRIPQLIESFPIPSLRAELPANMASSAASVFAFWMEQILEVTAARQKEPMRRA